MMSDARETLSAFVDREPVDPDLLAAVLEDREARALLVDFVRLRAAIADDDQEDQNGLTATALRRPFARPVSGWKRKAAAVVLLAAGLSGGFWIGERAAEPRPPKPDRVVEFTPGVDWHATSDGSEGGL